jgi:peptide chain release factor subunit 1
MNLTDQLDRLAAYEPSSFPVVSLYLNTRPGQHGRDQHQAFIRKEFKARSGTYPAGSPERESLDRDLGRIAQYLETELQVSSNGLAVFACSGSGLFEAIQTQAPIDHHWLSISDRPHLYPLARLESQYPRYAALLIDTNTARILVFAAGGLVKSREISGVKTRRTSEGGWSQARFQRHVNNVHLQHTKEVVEALEKIVAQEGITQIVVAGDDVITPLLREQMPKHLADKIIDHVRLDTHASLQHVVAVSLDAMRRMNDRTDREKVEAAVGAYRAGGLGVVGPEEALRALLKGQVDELLLSATMNSLREVSVLPAEVAAVNDSTLGEAAIDTIAAGEPAGARPQVVRLADELVTKAKQTGARTTFVEDPSLLAGYGGVAALLRFRI